MKYPQLVSTRAVNAISDWLVARLEQLGVEAPHIYTRLLLSLLQSTVQLNDPIEFSNLESFLASRKGSGRRYRECDIDELKKYNAVQCIKNIVSSDQEIASIENLVEELFERLKDIEKQSSDSEDDDRGPVATLSITHRYNRSQQRREVPANSKSCRASCAAESSRSAEVAGTSASAKRLQEREREYWRAFPALSKQMGDIAPRWRHPSKWMLWPSDKPKDDAKKNASTSSASSTMSSNSDAEDGNQAAAKRANEQRNIKEEEEDAMMEDTVKNTEGAANVSGVELCDDIVDENDEIDDDEASCSVNAAGYGSGAIKRNSKRRRSRALSRKNPAGGNNSDSNNAGNNRSQASGGKNKRNLSPSCWDTDFEGCWEMGRDLIKEFITSQNRNARNRSTSESAVSYNKQSARQVAPANEGADDNCESAKNAEQQQPTEEPLVENKDTAEGEKVCANKAVTTPTLPPVDMSFCDYDDFDDTLASVSELTNDGPLAMLATSEGACAMPPSTNAKRLYERELLPNDTKSDVQSDFAQFEAKFNSSVEALWKDADRSVEKEFSPFGDGNKLNIFNFGNGNSKHFSGPTSLPTDAPFSRNLKNFWSNYYNHHFDLSKMLPTSVIGEKAKELDVLMQNKANDKGEAAFKSNGSGFSEANHFSNTQQEGVNPAGGPTSDYYSMPSNLEDIEKAKSQRSGLRHNSVCSDSGNSLSAHRAGGTIGEERKTPVALFLQNSIWSENANFGGGDSDETFYFKVHNSGNQLNAYDDNNREETLQCDATTSGVNVNNDSGFVFTAPYSASKWSEGINAGPPQGNVPTPLLQHKQQCGNQNNSYHLGLNSTDCTDSSSSSACTSGASNWHHLPISEAKNDWSAEQMRDTNAPHDTGSMAAPKITLANHSTTDSGFVAYSRIKAVLKLQLSSDGNAMNDAAAKQQQRNYPPRTNSKEQQQQRYALEMMDDGENLLTSERTHFHPIKSYMDGHTFDICSELDVIDYERSASGYLYYEEEKYLEYTRTDNFMVEDDVGIGASANPLYANSNCEAATVNAKADSARHSSKVKRIERDFVIKFRVQRTEMACQTDPEPPTARAVVSANKRNIVMNASATKTAQPHPISLIFSNAAKNLKANAANELVYSDTVEAFTRAMAHFPPPQASSSNHSAWWSMEADVGECLAASSNWNVYQAQPKLQQNAKNNNNDEDDAYEDAGSDVLHFYSSIDELPDGMAALHADVDMTSLEQQWSMNEIRKKCKEAGHMAAADAVDGGAIESVWGMCAACNNELKSIPANRLLRDELQVEADQIMSDLKYMQDLYIGRAGDAADADDDDDDDNNNNAENGDDDHQCDGESAAETVTSDSDWCAEDITADVTDECAVNTSSLNANNSNDELNEDHTMQQADSLNQNTTTVEGAANNSNDSETFTVIQKVNRLIAELLRPDNNADGVKQMDKQNATAACAKVNEPRQVEAEATQFSGNLWHTNSNERNIWQLNAGDNTNSLIVAGGGGVLGRGDSVSGGVGGAMHPIQLLRQFNVKPLETAVANVDNVFPSAAAADVDKYHRQMSWEHENLARIWQTSPPSPPQTQNVTMIINDAKPQAATEQKIVDPYEQQADIAEKNMRNLRANADVSVEATAVNLQLAQDFKKHKESKVAAALANAQLVDSALKLKAITRKRRHSASQNYFHAHLNSSATAAVAAVNSLVGGGVTPLQNNNNNNEIANLNSYALKSLRNSRNANELSLQNFLNASLRFGAAAAVAVAASNAKKCSDLANNLCGADFAFGCDSTATTGGRNQTIITCKYHLTAIEPLSVQQQNLDGDNNEYGLFTGNGIDGEGNTAAPLSSILDKNPSILKHVTMVSRPLTR
ncbi:PREDICTED: uncharacterized protein LOC108974911 [Bactrocera latifrons]|uniref:Uncharacterized protein KIAA0232 n=1 Tax=Bactrocera latifrons TaxID=174628 RepID=A0A0K8W681_BACLA|nr:PREDICTED: uncharacterized protein LOC108974911 [Bactrocera latifrons]XP_018798560.1 PREDICTED: uncharacterized protein LOC108974911 [Bactrocera latifrons]XP_018798562.1 PREDICTED: uncharacterized protein LOC108974911 [Bactrocera latifrons]XP_018798563.1 PREDICTED: uncharacterized protein LOC108974911 [Bactrocera latifrons]XP_018798564.1 PREDICTED: uncharacterized protein LOC108974911 [Bactrocera latifrons]